MKIVQETLAKIYESATSMIRWKDAQRRLYGKRNNFMIYDVAREEMWSMATVSRVVNRNSNVNQRLVREY